MMHSFLSDIFAQTIYQGSESLPVIKNKGIKYPQVTSKFFLGNTKDGISTFVPINRFDYKAGASISVFGEVIMKLAGGSRRKLRADIGTEVAGANEESAFELEVKLEREKMAGEVDELMKSVNHIATKALVMLGGIFASACVLW